MTSNTIICGDCLEVLPILPKVECVFADPPDNMGLKYEGFKDKLGAEEYEQWMYELIAAGRNAGHKFWLSINLKHLPTALRYSPHLNPRVFIWHYTFGQHRHTDCGNNFRPILRYGHFSQFYADDIRVQSERQKSGDKRADPRGRVPGDVWSFPRVVGNAKERRPWHPTQHPEALIERIIKFSCKPGGTVIDCFAGTGTVHRVAKRLGVNSISIEISRTYFDKISEE